MEDTGERILEIMKKLVRSDVDNGERLLEIMKK